MKFAGRKYKKEIIKKNNDRINNEQRTTKQRQISIVTKYKYTYM